MRLCPRGSRRLYLGGVIVRESGTFAKFEFAFFYGTYFLNKRRNKNPARKRGRASRRFYTGGKTRRHYGFVCRQYFSTNKTPTGLKINASIGPNVPLVCNERLARAPYGAIQTQTLVKISRDRLQFHVASFYFVRNGSAEPDLRARLAPGLRFKRLRYSNDGVSTILRLATPLIVAFPEAFVTRALKATVARLNIASPAV